MRRICPSIKSATPNATWASAGTNIRASSRLGTGQGWDEDDDSRLGRRRHRRASCNSLQARPYFALRPAACAGTLRPIMHARAMRIAQCVQASLSSSARALDTRTESERSPPAVTHDTRPRPRSLPPSPWPPPATVEVPRNYKAGISSRASPFVLPSFRARRIRVSVRVRVRDVQPRLPLMMTGTAQSQHCRAGEGGSRASVQQQRQRWQEKREASASRADGAAYGRFGARSWGPRNVRARLRVKAVHKLGSASRTYARTPTSSTASQCSR